MIRVFILNDKKTCVNVDNDTDAQRLIDNGAFEIQDLSVFNGHENLVSAENTVVNPKDMSVTFTYPEDEQTLFQLQQEQTALETHEGMLDWLPSYCRQPQLIANSSYMPALE